MRRPFGHLPYTLRLSLMLVAIFSLVALGAAGQQSPVDDKNCASGTHSTGLGSVQDAKLDTVLGNPEDYFGKTVTVQGEMHRTFSDRVFSIEDDDFLRDDDLLIITTASKSEVVTPVKDSIEEGEDVRVTGVIVPFHRSEMECKYGPLQIESRASHYKEGDPVMIIERQKVASTGETADREAVQLPDREVQVEPEPVPEELDQRVESEEPAAVAPAEEPVDQEPVESEELPRTAGELPLLALGGVLSLLAGLGVRFHRR